MCDHRLNATYLLETNVIGVFSEALTADVQCVFTDQTVSVGAGAAKNYKKKSQFIKNLLISMEFDDDSVNM